MFRLAIIALAITAGFSIAEDEEVVARGKCVSACINVSLSCQQECPTKIEEPRFNCLNACYADYRECKPPCDVIAN